MTGQVERVVLKERPEAAVRLYCVPPAGSGSGFYLPWVGAAPSWVEVCSISLPGRGRRVREPSLTDPAEVSALVAGVLDDGEDTRPFAVFGHSVGALIAFEAVRHLRATGGHRPLWLGLSSLRGPQDSAYAKGLLPLVTGGFDGVAQLVGGAVPERFVRNPVVAAAAYTALLADCLLLLHHRLRSEAVLDVPWSLYGAADDPTASVEQLRAWNELFAAPAEPRVFPGNHMYPRGQARALTRQVITDIEAVAGAVVAAV
ncbi:MULTISPECIES: thioesterase II family protein [Streptomyces]|uniref:thioesterase II family protein n=1 Tax=Streptomyces TaxID=1883 RepID=UPI001E401AB0|nr:MULTISPECIES: alpha/beta fold hydrolase [Streptomyces]UFQ19318.1 alpha/beta fold hydrolase [Streptomyces huasconensis]WCL88938.1 alpha/beta fold hydrolase [Streptomyces sp. JCM 35825]